MLYLFHGEDEFSRSEAIAQLRQQMDPVVGELNTNWLDGRTLTTGELQAVCDTVPFMGDRRLVIVRDLLSSSARGNARGARRERNETGEEPGRLRDLETYLPRLPETTWLVLSEARSLPDSHALLRVARERGQERRFAVPTGPDLEQWISRQAGRQGVTIAPDAAALLATWVGPNLRLLDQELAKLATFLGGSGTVKRRDVEQLVSSLQEANIFHMVDALGSREGRRALLLLHQLLDEGAAPLYLLTMVTRQFRLLLLARELDARGVAPADMAQQMEVAPFVARKCLQQAMNFRPDDLKAIMAQLLEIDVGIKTGQTDGPLALDLFVMRWAGRRPAGRP